MKLVAAAFQDRIYTSTNGGIDWQVTSAPMKNWQAVASSADGTTLIAGTYGDRIYVSNDSGATWTPASVGSLRWWSVASSSEGSQLVAVDRGLNGGGIYILKAPPAPALKITLSAANVVLAWPSQSLGYIPQQTSALGTPWTDVTEAPVLGNLEFQVTVPLSGSQEFFRLRHP